MRIYGLKLAICLVMLTMAPAFSQTTNDEATLNSASAPVAQIYLPAAGGVDVYSVNAAGKLTLVKGSPFPVTGEMEDVNGKYLISVGNTWLHAYPIESNGGLGKQVVPSTPRLTAAHSAEKPGARRSTAPASICMSIYFCLVTETATPAPLCSHIRLSPTANSSTWATSKRMATRKD